MRLNRTFWHKSNGRLCLDTQSLVAFIIGIGCLAAAGVAHAAEAAVAQMPMRQFPLGQVFAILFLMLGPFKIVGPFFKVTQGADGRLTRQIAVLATVFSAIALLIAGFLGETILNSYGISLPVLTLSGGIILFLVALKNILEQFAPAEPHAGEAGAPPAAAMKVAMALAFPTIVTPYGIAAVVVLVALSQTLEGRVTIGTVVVAIMVLNLIVMLLARRLQIVFAMVLPIFGAVLGVVQVALGLQFINNALHQLGVL